MGSWFVRQPNGKYARFSTVVDDFTHLNLSRQEAIQVCMDWFHGMSQREAANWLRRADRDTPIKGSEVVAPKGLRRWTDAIQTVRVVHGKRKAERRDKAGKKP